MRTETPSRQARIRVCEKDGKTVAADSATAGILIQLFGNAELNSVRRELLRDLSHGLISFQRVPAAEA